MRTEAAHLVTVTYHSARSAIGALDARICFFSLEAASILRSTPRRKICTLVFVYFVCSITGVYTIYSMQFALAKTLRMIELLREKQKNDDHNNIPFKVWETPGRMCISCSNFHHTHTALSIALSDPYYKKYLAYEVQTQTSHQRPFFTLNYGPIAYTYVFFCNLYY